MKQQYQVSIHYLEKHMQQKTAKASPSESLESTEALPSPSDLFLGW
jgi:hypothetical protein